MGVLGQQKDNRTIFHGVYDTSTEDKRQFLENILPDTGNINLGYLG